MTEEEYLNARIKEIEHSTKKLMITEKHRNNQLSALIFYKNALERLKAKNDENSLT